MAMEDRVKSSGVKLSPGEAALFSSIVERVYPDPKEGTVLPVEPGEKRAARGLAGKGLVVLGMGSNGADQMTFTKLGQAIYEQHLTDRSDKE